MPRRSTCTDCGKQVEVGRGSRDQPTCRECRASRTRGQRVDHTFTKRIGCQEPKWPNCWTCGTSMDKRHGARFCSRRCQPSSTQSGRKRDLECAWCGGCFRGELSKRHEPCCCRTCQTNLSLYQRGYNVSPWWPGIEQLWDSKRRRKARITVTQVKPIRREEVFRRDGYRCYICGRRLRKHHRAPHPRAATIDHLHPLAKGGPHVMDNVATACLACNVAKGDRIDQEWGTHPSPRVGGGLRGGTALRSATGSELRAAEVSGRR